MQDGQSGITAPSRGTETWDMLGEGHWILTRQPQGDHTVKQVPFRCHPVQHLV